MRNPFKIVFADEPTALEYFIIVITILSVIVLTAYISYNVLSFIIY